METTEVLREWDLGRTAARDFTARLVQTVDADGYPRRSFELVARRHDGREFVTRLPIRCLEAVAAAADEARELVR